jgi:glycosyltransferase involved in cell wall biosynthesis/SAM-dependent methyltransferase/phosphoglycolate phosphatase-like HAD superfamily hydrolase
MSAELWDNVFLSTPLEAVTVPSPLGNEVARLFSLYLDPGATLLEAGSGAGELSAHLAHAGYRVTLLDQSREAIRLSQKVFAREGLTGSWFSGDLFSLPFPDHSFDCVWNSGVLEHFSAEDLDRALAEMARVARQYVIALVPNARCLFYRVAKWRMESDGSWPYGVEHPITSLTDAFVRAGLSVLDQVYLGVDQGLVWGDKFGLPEHVKKAILDWHLNEAFPSDALPSLAYLLACVGTVSSTNNSIDLKTPQVGTPIQRFLLLAEKTATLLASLPKAEAFATATAVLYDLQRTNAELPSRIVAALSGQYATAAELQGRLSDLTGAFTRIAEGVAGIQSLTEFLRDRFVTAEDSARRNAEARDEALARLAALEARLAVAESSSRELATIAAERSALIESLRDRLATAEDSARRNAEARDEALSRLAALEARLAVAESSSRELATIAAERSALEVAVRTLTEEAETAKRTAADYAATVTELANTRRQAAAAMADLSRIHQSRSWRVLSRYWSARRRVVSAVRRAATWPPVQATGRRLYRVLPRGLRRRVRGAYARVAGYAVSSTGTTSEQTVGAYTGVLNTSRAGDNRALKCGITDLVSIILPYYKQPEYLPMAIKSVMDQTYQNWELIIVDDEGDTGDPSVWSQLPDDPRITVVRQSHAGLPQALSTGFRRARGELWTWTSADNLYLPEAIETLVRSLKGTSRVGMVFANYAIIGDDGQRLHHSDFRVHNQDHEDDSIIRLPGDTTVLGHIKDNFIGPCFMYRAWCGRLLGDYDGEMGTEDYDYWMQMQRWFGIHRVSDDRPYYLYRVHGNSLSARARQIGIHERVDRLMTFEVARHGFYSQPTSWLALGDISHDALAALNATNDEKTWLQGTKRCVVCGHYGLRDAERVTNAYGEVPVVYIGDDPSELLTASGPALSTLVLVVARRAETLACAELLGLRGVLAESTEAATVAVSTCGEVELARRLRAVVHPPRAVVDVTPGSVVFDVDALASGGMERVVHDLALGFREVGWKVRVVTRARGLMWNSLCASGVECHHVRTASDIVRIVEEAKPDIVNVHYAYDWVRAYADLQVPLLVTVHNSYVWLPPDRIDFIRNSSHAVRRHIAVSRSVAEFAMRRLGLSPSQITVSGNGVSREFARKTLSDESARATARQNLGLPQTAVCFALCASIYPPKGQRIAVEALKRLGRDDVFLVLAGSEMDAVYAREVQRAIDGLGVRTFIRNLGFCKDVTDIYGAADALLAPSLWEGDSLTIREAQWCGLPVVATAVGAATDVITSDELGVLVDVPYSVSDLQYETLGDSIATAESVLPDRVAAAMERVVSRIDDYRAARENIARIGRSRADPTGVIQRYAEAFDVVRRGWM